MADNLTESMKYYAGLNLTKCFYVQKGSVNYPHNQESFNLFGKSYKNNSFPVFSNSLSDVVNGLYETNQVMNNISRNKTDTTDVFYFGMNKDDKDPNSTAYKLSQVNSLDGDINTTELLVPSIVLDVCRKIIASEKEWVGGNSNPDKGKTIEEEGNEFVFDGKNINEYLNELLPDTFGRLTGGVSSIKFYNDIYSGDNLAGHICNFTLNLTLDNSTVNFKIYFDPSDFFGDNLGNPGNIDIWSYFDSQDLCNMFYSGDLYTKISDQANPHTNKYIIDIDPDELQNLVIKDIMMNTFKYKRHKEMMTFDLDRRVFGDGNRIHKLNDNETDKRTKMRFYVFYSSSAKPSTNTIINKINELLDSTVKANVDKFNDNNILFSDFGNSEEVWVPNAIQYVYPDLMTNVQVVIRPFTSLSTNSSENAVSDKLRMSSEGVAFATSSTNDSGPTWTDGDRRGKIIQIISPCIPKEKLIESPNGVTAVNKLLAMPFLACLLNENKTKDSVSSSDDRSVYEYLQNYSQTCIELTNNLGGDVQWNVSDDYETKFKKLFTFAAMVFSGADPNLLSKSTPLINALHNDETIVFSANYNNSDILTDISFKINTFEYHIYDKDSGKSAT